MRDLGIAQRLRDAGLKVVEVAGWQTRGDDVFSPAGAVDHHTASSPLGNAPSLAICTYGRSDLPGPLCHVLVARDNTCYVIASGRANHAGLGGWAGLSGNSSVYGVERENVGTPAEPWRPDQTLTAARVHAALIRGRTTVDKVCLHREWAPTRKIDAHTITGDELRTLVGRVLAGTIEEDEMNEAQEKKLDALALKVEEMGQLVVPLLKERNEVEYARLQGILERAARPDPKLLAKAMKQIDASIEEEKLERLLRRVLDEVTGD